MQNSFGNEREEQTNIRHDLFLYVIINGRANCEVYVASVIVAKRIWSIGGHIVIEGKWSTWRKGVPQPLLSPQTPHEMPWREDFVIFHRTA